jgi:membrane-bound lytic murein transglycosylase A
MDISMNKKYLLIIALLAFLGGCARAPLENPQGAFILAEAPADLADSFPVDTLKIALERTIAAHEKGANQPESYQFQSREIPRADYIKALRELLKVSHSQQEFADFVRTNFDFYFVYGDKEPGDVFSTGYYDPVMDGSRTRTVKHSRPIYRRPKDLVSVDMEAFAQALPDSESLQAFKTAAKSRRPQLTGRLDSGSNRVVPYFTRAEIDGEEKLKGQGLELVWLDPIDAFFVEIQGSGIVNFSNGTSMRVGYAGQNGHPYFALGKALIHAIPLELMSMQRIRLYLQSVSAKERDEYLFKNPSFVFFRELEGQSKTFSGAEVTPQRTIASDSFLFSKGLLGFLSIELPIFSDADSLEPSGWELKPRWVFDQDTGGAIKGGGRIDLYMGADTYSARAAGVMKRRGKLWMVAPKQEFLDRLVK